MEDCITDKTAESVMCVCRGLESMVGEDGVVGFKPKTAYAVRAGRGGSERCKKDSLTLTSKKESSSNWLNIKD